MYRLTKHIDRDNLCIHNIIVILKSNQLMINLT